MAIVAELPGTSPVAVILERLDGVKRSGTGWIGRCPAHDDHRPSLKVDSGEDGRALLHCYAGCDVEAIVEAIRLAPSGLFVRDDRGAGPAKPAPRAIAATFDYRDADGSLIYQTVRYVPKGFAQRRPDGNGGWVWNLQGVAPLPYRLPELVSSSGLVIVAEGERCVDALAAAGFTATTNHGGAGKWTTAHAACLAGRDVAISPDHDEPGRRHARVVAETLHGIARSVRVLDPLPGVGDKGDAADWFDAGHTRGELIRIVNDAPDWTPESMAGVDEHGDDDPSPAATRFHPLSIAELEALQLPEREDVVDGGLLVAGSVTLFSAREKSGKTMLCTDLACSIVAEQPFLDRAVAPGPVVFIALEENIREVRRRILDRLGTQRDVPLYVLPANGFSEDVFRLDHPASMGMFAAMIREYGASVVFVDTMREAHRMRENEGDDMGPLMRPLRQIAHDSNCAVVLLHHQNKMGGSRGSTAIAAGVDQLWSFQRTDTEQDGDTPPVGRLTVEGRFGPRQVIGIRLGDGLRWQVDHSLELVDQTLRGRVLGTLGRHVEGMTATEIASALDARLKTIQNEMSRILQETPAPIATTGAGTKGNPRRYVSVTPELFPNDSRNDGSDEIEMVPKFPRVGVGNDGNHFETLDPTGTDDDWEVF